MKRHVLIPTVLLVAVLAAVTGCQSLILRITGMRPFVDDRFAGWVNAGADETELDRALGRIHDPKGEGPGSWVFELAETASRHEKSAVDAENAGRIEAAREAYRKAAVYYYIARFPFVGNPSKAEAYRRHIRCYLKWAESFDPPLEIVRIPFEDKEIIGYLRVPRVEKPPVVVFTGGVDTWKSDIDGMVGPMLAEGLAVFALDMPGTGESPWPLAPESDRVHRRVFEYLKTRTDLSADRLGLCMVSFGGYYAVRLGLTAPEVKAAINVGGPLVLSFNEKHAEKVPEVMVKTIAHAMGVDVELPLDEMVPKIQPFSLADLLKNPPHRPAMLSINGTEDELVPIDDLYVISRSGVRQEEWVFEEDGHCAMGHMNEWAPRAAAWMKEKLTK